MVPLRALPSPVSRMVERLTTDPTVTGSVETKAVLGSRAGRRTGVVLAHERATNVGDRSFADAFGRNERITVDDALRDRLADRYDDLRYDLHVTLATPDPVNDLTAGRTVAYAVPRELFNRAVIGERVEARTVRGPRLVSG